MLQELLEFSPLTWLNAELETAPMTEGSPVTFQTADLSQQSSVRFLGYQRGQEPVPVL